MAAVAAIPELRMRAGDVLEKSQRDGKVGVRGFQGWSAGAPGNKRGDRCWLGMLSESGSRLGGLMRRHT